jgi:DNA-binding NarL/FixJ family response regulator
VIEITRPFYRTPRNPARLGSQSVSARAQCLVIDGHPLVRLGMRDALSDGFEVEEVATRFEAVELVQDIGSFDVAVVDMRWHAPSTNGHIGGTEAIRALRKTEPSLGIVAHGERPERHLANAAIQAGAGAFVSRTAGPDQLRRAVDAVMAQESFLDPDVPPSGSRGKLTRRQREILQLLADGGSINQAARELGLSDETVKTHTKNILARLEARNRPHAVAIAMRESLIQ